MLAARLIKTGAPPQSIPVVMTKEKDSSLTFCGALWYWVRKWRQKGSHYGRSEKRSLTWPIRQYSVSQSLYRYWKNMFAERAREKTAFICKPEAFHFTLDLFGLMKESLASRSWRKVFLISSFSKSVFSRQYHWLKRHCKTYELLYCWTWPLNGRWPEDINELSLCVLVASNGGVHYSQIWRCTWFGDNLNFFGSIPTTTEEIMYKCRCVTMSSA